MNFETPENVFRAFIPTEEEVQSRGQVRKQQEIIKNHKIVSCQIERERIYQGDTIHIQDSNELSINEGTYIYIHYLSIYNLW